MIIIIIIGSKINYTSCGLWNDLIYIAAQGNFLLKKKLKMLAYNLK